MGGGNLEKSLVLLIGMPGCGKTTIGKIIASTLNYEFYDMDEYIEDISGKSIKELFTISEEYFREYETRACEELSNKKRAIIASGGGVVKREKNIDFFKKESVIVFIDRAVEDILCDVDTDSRPLLNTGKDKLYEIYKERYKLYKKYCHREIKNKGLLVDVIFQLEKDLKDDLGI